MEEDYLLISGIQHFMFCRRQWALIHMEDSWEENFHTAEGRILHNRVHDDSLTTRRNGIITLRGIPIRSNRLRITGMCDAVELIPDESGISLKNRSGKWNIHPVEYKRGRPKSNDCDRLQLTAECVCLEEMLSCTIEQGSLYYGSIRRREEVSIDESLRDKLNSVINEMWNFYKRRYTPRVKTGKMCNSCSLSNVCMPSLMKERDVIKYINKHIHEEST